ncbi:MAG: 3-isopropylmalate dehydratase small subunit [Pseudorhodobacter sp.]
MGGWTRVEGQAAGLALENIDTDQLIPARFMSAPRSQGYGGFLLYDLRHDNDGKPIAGFPLNQGKASILVARRNFGCGSSREAAVYALVDGGFRVVIAPSFGDIFAANSVNNGLLPARVSEADADRLIAAAPLALEVDLEGMRIAGAGYDIGFELDPVWRRKLMNGWDDIDLTAIHSGQITEFAERRRKAAPWVWSG